MRLIGCIYVLLINLFKTYLYMLAVYSFCDIIYIIVYYVCNLHFFYFTSLILCTCINHVPLTYVIAIYHRLITLGSK